MDLYEGVKITDVKGRHGISLCSEENLEGLSEEMGVSEEPGVASEGEAWGKYKDSVK